MAGGEVGVEEAVDGEVGVTADRAGEVAVVLARQRVVADLFGGVLGAGEALEDGEVDREGLGLALDGGEEGLQRLAVHVLGELVAGDFDEVAEALGAGGLGLGVGSAEEGDVGVVEEARDGLVGFDHEHLDERVGEAGVLGLGADDFAFLVELELHDGKVEDDLPLLVAALLEALGEVVHLGDELDDGGVVVGEGAVALGVGHDVGAVWVVTSSTRSRRPC